MQSELVALTFLAGLLASWAIAFIVGRGMGRAEMVKERDYYRRIVAEQFAEFREQDFEPMPREDPPHYDWHRRWRG